MVWLLRSRSCSRADNEEDRGGAKDGGVSSNRRMADTADSEVRDDKNCHHHHHHIIKTWASEMRVVMISVIISFTRNYHYHHRLLVA